MNTMLNLDNAILSDRNGMYGGTTSPKEGIILDDEYWLVKYPKRLKLISTSDMTYSASPLSEYIGSHIYKILGFNVHDTALGIRHNRVVVACKDFCTSAGELREIRTLKNIYAEELKNELELKSESHDEGSVYVTQLNELLLHFTYNPVLSSVKGLEERFWDCLLIDALIQHGDRNSGNWGLLFKNGLYELAPVFANGSAFSPQLSDAQMIEIMAAEDTFRNYSLHIITAYGSNGHHFDLKYFLSRDDCKGLERSIIKLVPIITERFSQIEALIQCIPDSHDGVTVCSPARKRFYIEGMRTRIDTLLVSAYERILYAYHNYPAY